MRVYLKETVLEAALARIERVFQEFDNVVVNTSGGKDSTVIFHLSLMVARKLDRLPIKVLFIDQEAEWFSTIEQIEYMMLHPDVDPYWLQVPIRLFNATSTHEPWLYCWDSAAKDRWIRPQHPVSIKVNSYGTDRFHPMFSRFLATEFPDEPAAQLAGVRTEESPARLLGITGNLTYKDITWGKKDNAAKGHYTFYPIYDWFYADVWKAIHEHGWPYNRIYDQQYRYGYPVRDMRVSNLHHETSVQHLWYMQEIEPDIHERLTQRIGGIDTASKLGKADYFVRKLPFMFKTWREYRDYLLEHLITNPEWRANLRRQFDNMDPVYGEALGDKYYRTCIQSILTNDWEGVKLENFRVNPNQHMIRKRLKGLKVY